MRILLFFVSFFYLFHVSAQTIQATEEDIVKNITINLLGRVPFPEEKVILSDILKKCGTKRFECTVDYLMATPAFYKHMEEQLREEYLEGVSKPNIIEYITDFYQLEKARTKSIYYDFFRTEFIHLYQLGQLLKGNYPDSMNISSLQRLLVHNYVYDQINMGVDNFVLSIFQHFMMRKPTHFELAESKKMVEGHPGILFNRTGASKDDFLNILFSSDNFFEGQVRYWYVKIMHEEPGIDEIIQYLPVIKETGSAETLIKSLLLKQSSL